MHKTIEIASSPKIILMANQKVHALNQISFERALELQDKELKRGRECYIVLSEERRARLDVQVLEEYDVLVSGYFDYTTLDCGEADSAEIVKWFNKELLDKLNIKYYDKVQ